MDRRKDKQMDKANKISMPKPLWLLLPVHVDYFLKANRSVLQKLTLYVQVLYDHMTLWPSHIVQSENVKGDSTSRQKPWEYCNAIDSATSLQW